MAKVVMPLDCQAFQARLVMDAIEALTRNHDSMPARFTLDDGSQLECLEVVRRVPGRRVVFRGVWQGQPVYAKLFIGRRASHYAARDRAGVLRLQAANITTPDLLADATIRVQACSVLVFAAIEQAMNAEQLMAFSAPDARLQLAHALVQELAWHHNAGLYQSDLYLKNFLVRDRRIWTIDGDAIRPLPSWRKMRCAEHNLAVLLSKFDALDMEAWLPDLLVTYQKVRDGDLSLSVRRMHHAVARHRARIVRGYADKKIFRQCTDVTVQQSFTRFVAVARRFLTSPITEPLSSLDTLIDDSHSQRFKSGNTCTVSLVQLGSHPVVVKRYNIKSFWHRLSRAFRSTRAAQSWRAAHRLLMYGFKTPLPVALVEERWVCLRGRAYFLSEYIDAPDVYAYFAQEGQLAKKQAVAERIAQMFYKLNVLKIAHGDCKATNIKIVQGEPALIDLDSLQEYRFRCLFVRKHVKDLRRFMRNWQQQPETFALLVQAFNKVYGNDCQLVSAGLSIGKVKS